MTRKKQGALDGLQIGAGIALCVLAYQLYLIPNDIAPGGFTGIGQLVHSVLGYPVGLVALALNAPLFYLSFRSLGMAFGLKSVLATVALSVLLDVLPLPAVTREPLLAAVFGGVMAGAGFGLVLRGGASTGGSDLLGKLICEHRPWIRVSAVIFAVDALVILSSAYLYGATAAMYALISAFFLSRVLDGVLEGLSAAKAYLIISEKSEEIARRILSEMERGVTGINARGMYSGTDRQVLLCVVNRFEAAHLRSIVKQADERAFMMATDIYEALGEGFKPNR